MSISSVSAGSSQAYDTSSWDQRRQALQSLGQDLQAGNLSAAQSDFATLQQNRPSASGAASALSQLTGGAATSTPQGTGSIGKAVQQLSTDLQAGNLSAAQQDLSTLQQNLQQASGGHHHHHHHGGGSSSSQQGGISQLFDQLGTDLQSGNLSAALKAYQSLAQDFGQSGSGDPTSAATLLAGQGTVSAFA